MKKTTVLQFLVLLLVLSFPLLSIAQGGPGDPGGDPDVPIDGGLSLLAAAGVGYIAKKGYEKRKKAQANTEK